jgi:hypothetical protein
MKFHDIESIGNFKIEKASTLPSWQASDESRLLYVEDEDKIYYADGSEWKEVGSGSGGGGSDHILEAKTSDYTLVAEDLGGSKTFINTAATGEINLTLPAGAVNYKTSFLVTEEEYLKVTANGTETFKYLGSESAEGGYIRNNVIGTTWTIIWSGSEWIITNLEGSLFYDE